MNPGIDPTLDPSDLATLCPEAMAYLNAPDEASHHAALMAIEDLADQVAGLASTLAGLADAGRLDPRTLVSPRLQAVIERHREPVGKGVVR